METAIHRPLEQGGPPPQWTTGLPPTFPRPALPPSIYSHMSGWPHVRSTPSGARGRVVASYSLAVVALVLVPPLFGGMAIWLGVSAERRGDPLGRAAWLVAVVATVVGMALAVLVTVAGGQS